MEFMISKTKHILLNTSDLLPFCKTRVKQQPLQAHPSLSFNIHKLYVPYQKHVYSTTQRPSMIKFCRITATTIHRGSKTTSYCNRYNTTSFKFKKIRNTIQKYDFHSSHVSMISNNDDDTPMSHRKVWKATIRMDDKSNNDSNAMKTDRKDNISPMNWDTRVIDQTHYSELVEELVQQIADQPDMFGSGKMKQQQLGVLHHDPATDMQLLTDNYTVKAVASALRDREDALQMAAILASENKISDLLSFLQIYHPKYVLERRQMQTTDKQKHHIKIFNPNDTLSDVNVEDNVTAVDGISTKTTNDPTTSLHLDASRQMLRKALMRMPRTITTAHSKRAGVCVPLCLCNGIPSVLLEKRSAQLRNHPNEVCFPGGMVCDIQDQTIVSTSIREMKEEIGGLDYSAGTIQGLTTPIEVIGILRLNWGEVHHLTGVAVTPVVCYLGELPDDLLPNPEEVAEIFTIPLSDLLNKSFWIHREALAPIFIGGPYIIWGLTGYILERFAIELGRLR